MRHLLVALSLLVGSVRSADAQVSVGVDIGIRVPVFPELVLVPGYPVYYDPRGDSNYFFYDGVYWVFQDDNWYASNWYDGPWRVVRPERVPLYVLRVPVRYYRRPPPYFGGWHADAPPRWGDHWGRGWEGRHRGWDRWDHRAVPRPAPLPAYQRDYSGDRYPREWDRQRSIRSESYRYRPRESFTREAYDHRGHPGPRAEPDRGYPGPRAEPERRYPGPRAEPDRGPPGRQQPQERGRGHGPDRRDDRERDEHDRDRR